MRDQHLQDAQEAMNTFDQLSRYLVKDDPSEFLRWAIPIARAEPEVRAAGRTLRVRLCLATRIGAADTIAELVDADGTGPPWCLVVEFFTRPDPDATDRTLEIHRPLPS